MYIASTLGSNMFNFITAERDFFSIPFEDCAEGAWKMGFMVEIFIF